MTGIRLLCTRGWAVLLATGLATALWAQQPRRLAGKKSFQAQSNSTVAFSARDNRELAQLLRSYEDSTWKAALIEHRLRAAPGKKPAGESAHSMSPNYPSLPADYTVSVPITKDDIDFPHATAHAGFHIAAWRR